MYSGVHDESLIADGPAAPPVPGDTRKASPSEELVFAVIQQAIADYTHGPRRREHHDAAQWFADGSAHLFSFRWCCAVLGLEADYLLNHRDRWASLHDRVASRKAFEAARRREGREAA
ncbi:MAG: hypothetical protein ABI624_16650 [Casimicrobiaceae bacterium]